MESSNLRDEVHELLNKMPDSELNAIRRFLQRRMTEGIFRTTEPMRQSVEDKKRDGVWARVFAEPLPRPGSPEACLRLVGTLTLDESNKMEEVIDEMRRLDRESVEKAWKEGKDLP